MGVHIASTDPYPIVSQQLGSYWPGIPDFKAISKSLLASASNWERPERCFVPKNSKVRQRSLN